MPYEIERKFLIHKNKLPDDLPKGYFIKQAYIKTQNNSTVRIRTRDDEAMITLKGPKQNITRLEFEHKIPYDEAVEIIHELCDDAFIEKTRVYINYQGHEWEIDFFHGKNKGLIVAEIELENEDEVFEKPDWVGEEVTYEPRFRNSRLLYNPFCDWPEEQQMSLIKS